ncbi:MAG: indole-3-glycerol-phosphate synthase [Desulfovibrio sp.]|nr:indole-3-glycerol-phosphate synthase [Desulfovibrio sp.]
MLSRFAKVKAEEVARLKGLKAQGRFPRALAGVRPSFRKALAPKAGLPAVIAEYKRASPSKGVICEQVAVEDCALAYANAGASALSILTEEAFFKGSLDYLARARAALDVSGFGQPLLRKDFILDPVQVEATFATPASALLLIVRFTPSVALLRDLRLLAESQGMDAVVEVFDEADLEVARESGAGIIQVNARDLDSFKVDRKACLELARRHPPLPGEAWIAASGVLERAHLEEAGEAGFAACLVGTALMEGGRPGEALAQLLGKGEG